MPYQRQITEGPMHLHAVMTGTNTVDNFTGCLEDLLCKCRARHCLNAALAEAWPAGQSR